MYTLSSQLRYLFVLDKNGIESISTPAVLQNKLSKTHFHSCLLEMIILKRKYTGFWSLTT